ncbi:NUDIX hydrolase [Terrilactibacillus laevilacticus]|uniref:NUDIX hydrolase n=1 Tax=Terrilactibacillus laevilacticus TaxID=1380157 RepID=A0ABW5PS49_9BACI|nr:NUDIX hydrolase [Terrilactibacillus laevilacticus]
MSQFEEKTLSSETIFNGRIVQLVVEDVELPNGAKSKREIVKHPGAVAVIAQTDDNKVILVRQYRKPLEKEIYEIPAGKLEPGEEPESSAIREMEEETGYTCGSVQHLVSFYTSPGFSDELLHVYVATDLVKGKPHLDEDEFLEIEEVELNEALQMIQDHRIYDAKTVYAIQYLQMIQLSQK